MTWLDDERDKALKELILLFTPVLLATQNGAIADQSECNHRLQIGLNENLAICVACRMKFYGPCSFGVKAIGMAETPLA